MEKDNSTQDEKLFSESNQKTTSKDVIKKVLIIVVALLVFVFLVASNCNKKTVKQVKEKTATVQSGQESDSIDSYEEQINELNSKTGVGEKDEWSKKEQSQESMQQPLDNRPSVPGVTQTVTVDGQVNTNSARQPPSQYASSGSAQYGSNAPSSPPQPYKYTPPSEMKKRLDPEYGNIVEHFRNQREQSKWENAEYRELVSGKGNSLNAVDKPLKDLYENAGAVSSILNTRIPAGSRLIATLDQDISSDHPGVFTATVARPFEIKGYKLICQGGSNARDRINITVQKIISTSNKEFTLEGQVQNGYPGLTGHVTNHWVKRMGPALVNAAIGGGFLAWSMQGSDQGRVDTRDAIVSGVVEQSVSGVQNEVTRLGGDYPNTVLVRAGTQFEILITSEVVVQ